ncbi:Syg1p KNAG_0D01680 [Huiozyma naganishii CBS 8797]|uniref:EXS domain-containing protein n=1 Tax=Huiozyma naganishii (strain ATCC MYA-139 / BCRC 22969 / CBS 8797 / KCTC 17520 / NBRC 10181 / NCYC 3082 / Yp74L-3) TaxID=1071383 RepID=J7S5M5_HUIN7|nr:hypothetical protein KNAG_0D01680 [Kazachstania naganishii CBS 8797]CCK69919.1 hypothetical protein KNAG_0D01680 [Kazachstania naganishii CBS 8797]
MKFADHLRESAIPEWRDKYIDYKLGKKKLKYEYESVSRDPLKVVVTAASGDSAVDVERVGGPVDTEYGPQVHDEPSDPQLTDFQRKAIKDFIENWVIGVELVKCNEFYQWLLDDCRQKFTVLQKQIQIYHIQQQNYQNEFMEGENDGMIANSHATSTTSLDLSSEQHVNPYGTIGEDSVRSRRDTAWTRFKELLDDNKLLPSWPKNSTKLKDLILKLQGEHGEQISNTVKDTFAYNNLNTVSEMTIKQAQHLLSDAILEYYLFLQMVKTYRDLNVTGFRKMVKKFDKTLHTQELSKFMDFGRRNYALFKHVYANIQLMAKQMKQTASNQPSTDLVASNPKDDPLLWWENNVRTWFTKDLTNSPDDFKKNAKTLKKLLVEYTVTEQMIHRNNRSIIQMAVAGFFFGIALTIMVYTLGVSFVSDLQSHIHKILFPMWGGWYMVLLMLFLLQIDCLVWHRTKINYRFIMFGEVQARNGTKLFNNDFATSGIPLQLYALMFFVLFSGICAGLSFKMGHLTPWSFICIGGCILLFIMPRDYIPYWDKIVSTRKWLIIRAIRLVMAPFSPSEFGDFFLGDIICSLTYSMGDIATFFCIYTTDDETMCGSSHSRAMGVMSCLPSLWRCLQCLRRYADSGDSFPHLANAFKYTLGIGYNAALCAYRLANHSKSRRTPFIVFGAFNAFATSIWDLVIDWSLFQPSKRNWFLRNDLYLAGKRNWRDGSYSSKRKLVYYFAMIWDVLIRFQWIVWAVAPETIQQSAYTSFILGFVEVLRRFIWVIFRVENEHVANVHLFKVSSEAPLPYPIINEPDVDIELESRKKTDKGTCVKTRERSISDLTRYGMNFPRHTYHPMIRRRTSVFGSLSKSVPWAHAKDFQRSMIFPASNDKDQRESDSDSDER